MTFDGLVQSPAALAGSRFWRVGYLPAFALVASTTILLWSGAPRHRPRFGAAWHTAAGLGVAQLVLLALTMTVVAALLQPLQLPLVRALEGDLPGWLGAGPGRRRQLRRWRRLRGQARLSPGYTEAQLQAAGVAGTRLRQRFPLAEHLVRPTAFGNALTAMEDLAGREYGLDAVVAWPRLYAVLGEPVKALVDDRRDTVDAAAAMAAYGVAGTVVTTALLAPHGGWWALLILAPVLVAALAYHGAVHAAVAYGEAVRVAFDLHRTDLFAAMRVAAGTQEQEREAGRELSDLWRQGVPTQLSYHRPEVPSP